MSQESIKPQKLPLGTFAVIRRKGDRQHGAANRRYPDLNVTKTAPLVGISRSHLLQLINGECHPSIQVAQRIARVFAISLDEVGSWYNAEAKSVKQRRERKRLTKRRKLTTTATAAAAPAAATARKPAGVSPSQPD